MRDELKPCPFCGARESDNDQPLNVGWVIEDDAWMVVCDRCGSAGAEHDGRAEAVEAWNRRPSEVVKVETSFFDKEEIYPDCTVQVLTNTATGDVSVGWWKNETY